jgi:preprotein translocase subunit SecG
MFALVITIHVVACSLLILIVLVQQGRGGGLIESFSSAESIFGTKTSAFLVKATTVLAVVFFFTCLGLAFLSIQKNRSLVERYKPVSPVTAPVQGNTTAAPAPTAEQAKETPKTTEAPASSQVPAVADASARKPAGNEQ